MALGIALAGAGSMARPTKSPSLQTGRTATSDAPAQVAKTAGLHYVTDKSPGISRQRAGKGFSYMDPDGKLVRDATTLERIKTLAIPPAYKNVWICPDPRGHIQATGFDERGRKQYKYHVDWRQVRDGDKFAHILEFARALPHIRQRTKRDLGKSGLPREKILAGLVGLLEKTNIRVGNEEYARQNNSFGLTTLRDRHAKVDGSVIHFHFRGKSLKWHEIDLRDKRLANLIKKLQELPGQGLFQSRSERGEPVNIGSSDVNAYLKEIAGAEFTAKDFRTWNGTVLASMALREMEAFETTTGAQRNIVAAIKNVADQLGNTPAVCRKSYIHPALLECYREGTLAKVIETGRPARASQLRPEELALVKCLKARPKPKA